MDCLSAHQTKIHNGFDNWNKYGLLLFSFSLSSRLSFTFFLVVDSLESKFVCAFVYSNTTRTHTVGLLVLNQFFFTFPNLLNWEDRILAAAAIAFSPMRTFLTNWMTKTMKNQQRHDEYDFENDDNDDGDNDETDIWFYNVPFGQFFTFAISFAPTLSHDDCGCACACVCFDDVVCHISITTDKF